MPDRILSNLRRIWKSRPRPELSVLIGLALIALGSLAFVSIADEVTEGDVHAWEDSVLRSLRLPEDASRPIGPAWMRAAAVEITSLGSGPVLVLLVVAVCGFLALGHRWGVIYLVLAAAGGGSLLNYILKVFFDRARPSSIPHLAEVSSPSFPSGHSMVSSVIFLTLGALLAQNATRWREKVYFITVAAILTVLVGLTRVYLGVHYPTDVLAGWAAGTVWALACWLVARWLRNRHVPGI